MKSKWLKIFHSIFNVATTSSTSTGTTTTPACAAGCVNTTTSILSRIAFYSFDSNTNEITGVYPASGIASPTYVTGYVGSAIYFNAALSQRLSAPAMQLNSRSFTIEFWFYLVNAVSNNFAFFGQLSVINTQQQTLFLAVTGGRLIIGFFNDDVTSSRVLSDSTWYHAAFVYDMNIRRQLIYIDGLLDITSSVSSGPYLGTSGVITIGGADVYGGLGIPYLTGAIDHLTVTTRAKTACEISNDASLAVYFPFDGTFTDAGPNSLSVTSSGATFTSGFVNQAIYLSGVNSYIQISGLTGLGRPSYPFSIAFWLYPVVPGVLAQISSAASGRRTIPNRFLFPLISLKYRFSDSRSRLVHTIHRYFCRWKHRGTSTQKRWSICYQRIGPSVEYMDTCCSRLQSDQWTTIIHQWLPLLFHAKRNDLHGQWHAEFLDHRKCAQWCWVLQPGNSSKSFPRDDRWIPHL